MGTLVWLLWPDQHWTPEGEPAIAFGGALLFWLYLELVKGAGDAVQGPPPQVAYEPHPHDLDLFARFNATYSIADRHQLAEQDFRLPLDGRRLDGLEEVATVWRGADFEFHHEGLQTAFRQFQRRGSELLDLTGRKLFMSDNNPYVLSPLTDMDRERGISQNTIDGIQELNDKARELTDATNNLVRLSRDVLRTP